MGYNRRDLIGLGIGQAFVLSPMARFVARGILPFASIAAGLPDPLLAAQPVVAFKCLRPADLPILSALLPAALGLHPVELTPAHITKSLTTFDSILTGMTQGNRQDILLLLDLLNFSPARRFLGLRSAWQSVTNQELTRFLSGLQSSSLAFKRKIHYALLQLFDLSWYTQSFAWSAIAYPGPPEVIKPYLTQAEGE